MAASKKSDSQIGIFFSIYILITAAVAIAVGVLVHQNNKAKLAQADGPREEKPEQDVVVLPMIPGPEKKEEPKPRKSAPPKKKPVPKDPEPAGPTLSPEDEREILALFPDPKIKPLMEIVADWKNVPKSAYPKLVAIARDVDYEFREGGKTVARGRLPAGSMLIPQDLDGDQLTLKSGSLPVAVTVPVDDTDFKEQVIERYDRFVEKRHAEVVANRAAERKKRLEQLVAETEMSDWNDGSDERFKAVRESLRRGEAGVFSLNDASRWRWGGKEKLDGTEYETALVVIITDSAFGMSEHEVKALLREGEVVRWVDAATGRPL